VDGLKMSAATDRRSADPQRAGWWLYMLLCVVLGTVAGPARARDYGTGHALRDVNTVTVRLEGVLPEWRHYGFDKNDFKNRIIKRLTEAGLKVVGPAEAETNPSVALLDIHVYLDDMQLHYNSFGVFIKLKQKIPVGHGGGFVSDTIWRDWRVGGIYARQYRLLKPEIMKVVDNFLKDYRKEKYGY